MSCQCIPALPSQRHLQDFPVRVSSPSPSSAVPVERRHHCCVDCELGPSMQWKPVSNDFQPPPVQPVGLSEVHVANKHVQTNTCSAFPANPCCRRLQRPTSSPEHPCCCASCAVVAKSVEWTPATANRKGKGQSKSSKEQHTERRGVNPRQPTRRKGDERAACQRTTLRTKVASSSNSVNTCRMCATVSHPALVFRAYWCGEVATSTWAENCCAIVRATILLKVSPTTMPRTPPSGFRRAVTLPHLMAWRIPAGTLLRANNVATFPKAAPSAPLSRSTRT